MKRFATRTALLVAAAVIVAIVLLGLTFGVWLDDSSATPTTTTAEEDTTTTTVAEVAITTMLALPSTEAPTTTAAELTTTTLAETTTTTLPATNVSQPATNGNLLVVRIDDWGRILNQGDLVIESSLLSFYASETEAYNDLSAMRMKYGEQFVGELNPVYDGNRSMYWDGYPVAATNMVKFLSQEKPWLIEVMRTVIGNWDQLAASEQMKLIDRFCWTTMVVAPASFRTTHGNNEVGPQNPHFREVEKANNVVISPDDDDWVLTIVDVFLPSRVNAYLQEMGSDVRVQQVKVNGAYVIEVIGCQTVELIKIPGSVSVAVIVADESGVNVVGEAVFSTVCGNPTLPEFEPPRKEEATTTTSTTRSTTTTTCPTTTTSTTSTTTTSSTTSTTVPQTTTTLVESKGDDIPPMPSPCD